VKDNLLLISPTATLVSEVGLLLQSMKMTSLGRSYEEELSKIEDLIARLQTDLRRHPIAYHHSIAGRLYYNTSAPC